MSFPNIPDVNPDITVNRTDVINLLLASIAFEELGLAHIINSEAEKIQFVLGTLDVVRPPVPPTIDEVLKINRSVEKTLRTVIKTQMLLQFKLEDVLNIPNVVIHEDIATVTATSGTITVTDSDAAFYNTIEGGIQ